MLARLIFALAAIFCGLDGDASKTIHGLFWYVRGKRVRGRNLVFAAASKSAGFYRFWISNVEAKAIEKYSSSLLGDEERLSFAVIILRSKTGGEEAVRTTFESVRNAMGNGLDLACEIAFDDVDWPRQLEAAAAKNPKSWILPLKPGDTISPRLQTVLYSALALNPQARILFWDEDQLVKGRRINPWLKPDWDPLLLETRDFLTGSAIIAASMINEAESCLTNKCVTLPAMLETLNEEHLRSDPVHIPLIFTHRRPVSSQKLPSTHRAWPKHAGQPSVSIIIPTRDRVELLRTCIEGVGGTEIAGGVKVIVVDNESRCPETLSYLETLAKEGVRVIRVNGAFNFSALNNAAVKQSQSEFVCLLNNDIEILDPHWLSTLVSYAQRPGVGAVGPLLLYPDRTVQHAGVAIGVGGAAGHVYRGLPVDDEGHHRMHRTNRSVSAVTGACLLVRRSLYLAMGGLDEVLFPVAFNDVDFCLKLGSAGYRNLFIGDAQLIHHESKSRGDDMAPENFSRYLNELAALKAKWHTETALDPFHNPLMSRSSEEFALAV